MPASLLCCYCLRAGRSQLRSYADPVLVVDRVIPPGFRVCARHPTIPERRCGRCGWVHYSAGCVFLDAQGRQVRECPRCEALLGYEGAALKLSGRPLVRVVWSGGRPRVRYEGVRECGWVQWPKEQREVGALYEVDQLVPVVGGYFRPIGEVRRVGEALA